jgi:hypothetical protein
MEEEGSLIENNREKQDIVTDKYLDYLWIIILLLAAMLLFCLNLGEIGLQNRG